MTEEVKKRHGKTKEELDKISRATRFKAGKEQVEIAKRGAEKSAIVRREKKTMREILNILLEKQMTNKAGEEVTTKEEILAAQVAKALEGDLPATQFIRDTIGEKPTEKTQTELTLTQALVEFVDGKGDDKNSGEVPPAVN